MSKLASLALSIQNSQWFPTRFCFQSLSCSTELRLILQIFIFVPLCWAYLYRVHNSTLSSCPAELLFAKLSIMTEKGSEAVVCTNITVFGRLPKTAERGDEPPRFYE